MDVADVHLPILSVTEHQTRAAFRVTVIGRDRHEASTWIETLCRDALSPFDGADPPFAALMRLEVEAPPARGVPSGAAAIRATASGTGER